MKSRMISGRLVVVALGIAVQIAITGGLPIAPGTSDQSVTLKQPRRLDPPLQRAPIRVFLKSTSAAAAENTHHISTRGIPNELSDVAQSRPLEALGSAAAEVSSSSPLAADNLSRGLANWSGRPRSKRSRSEVSGWTKLQGTVIPAKKQSASTKRIWPIWTDKHESRWSAFVYSNRERNELRSERDAVRGKTWRRISKRRVKAIKSGVAERSQRERGAVGLSDNDVKELGSASLDDALVIQKRMEARLRRMKVEKPVANPEQWVTWKKDMQIEEAALLQVVERVATLRAAQSQASKNGGPMRPRNFVGLIDHELDLFRSSDPNERLALHRRLNSRLRTQQKGPHVRKNQSIWQRQSKSDLVWKQALGLRKHYSAEVIEEQIPKVLEAAASMSSDAAAKRIPTLLVNLVSKGKATAATAPKQDAVAAADAQQAGTSTDLFASSSSNRVGQPSTNGSQHLRKAAQSLSPPPAKRRKTSPPPSPAQADFPSWLPQAMVELASRPSGISQHHAAPGSGSSSEAVDAAARQPAVRSSAPPQE